MILYTNDKGNLKEVKEVPFKLEKHLQKLFEENLSTILGLTVVKSEFIIKNKRFDTLAFDEENKSFVIIEYKRDKSSSVIDQGFAYLHIMLENKAEFVLEINERCNRHFKRDDISWEQTKVIFVASSFNDNQKISTKFKDIAIELIEVKQFKDGHIIINSLKDDSSQVSVKTITKNDKVYESVAREIKVYTEDDHLNNGNDKIKELYEDLKSAILNLNSGIKVEAKKLYIAFKQSTNICDIEIQSNKLKIYLNAKWGTIDDPKHLFKDMRNVGHWGNGEYRAEISNDDNIGYIIDLIRQVIQKQ